jgi:hypothetical protein
MVQYNRPTQIRKHSVAAQTKYLAESSLGHFA